MGRYSQWQRALVVAGALAAGTALPGAVAAQAVAPGAQQDEPAMARPLKPNPEFARLPRYEGTLGDRPIVVHLGPKTDEEGVHGEYQFADTGEVVLLAGDRDGDTLEIEESNDGTNITGVWIGRFDATGALKADRMNSDESDPQPVVLRLAPGKRAALQVRDGRVQEIETVGGIVNLRTDD
ncbi:MULTISPECIES: hypothetical protein [Burkholderia]|uniref:Lipoprotein n=2 Tax=Burkholderia contaminans TaxID=488447 RepID=A0A1E3FLA1_9BURK|nr:MULTISPECIES: hypothetical protein [Burkholderia]UTP23668.1 hypothetical protein NMB33_08180 [Burkholderia sp. FXe9]KKL43750.1 hypothetical protein WR31_00625 [Burkholderia contaminans LMG 23361]MBA9830693.1 hypothetical protein [Burkholderia contaminans]MBA9837635.1 hypothetical protein [Burkholderia contaminans]MBA9861945.1 hypothetical protein [Burkholderia contaminans]